MSEILITSIYLLLNLILNLKSYLFIAYLQILKFGIRF